VQAGDVLLLGYNAQDPDDFSFAPLVNLAPGTQLKFTDNGWLSSGGFRLTEGICVYTAPAGGVPRGAIVSFRADSLCFTHPGRFQLATEGDQLLVYQGTEAAPTFLYGLGYKKSWSTLVSSNTSALPPGLTAGSSALYVPWANGAYAADRPRSGTVASLRTYLTAPGSWNGNNTARVSWAVTALQVLPTLLPAPPAGADSLLINLYHVFGNLDVSQVPTGRLNGYGVPFVALPAFGGTLADSNLTTSGTWRQAYATAVTSRVTGTETLPRLDTLSDRLERARAAGSAIPIALARIDYAALRPDAVTAGLLTVQNGQLADVPGRTQSPYQVQTLFVAGPARTVSQSGNVSFVLPGNLHVQQGGGTFRSLELDFGTGQSYQPATWDQPLALSYCSGTYRVKVRASYYLPGTSGTGAPYAAYESHFDLVVQDSTCGAQARYDLPGQAIYFPAQLGSGAAHPNFGASVYVRYGGQGTTANPVHTQLTKPLIVVEGYDSYWAAGSLTDWKNYSINDFMEDITFATDNNSSPSFNFRNGLDNIANYDIVFIDFTNGTDDITHNAEVFKRVLRWVNDTKAKDAAGNALFQNAVLGVSMGGLVARYGLADMVKSGETPGPDTYILATQDSPHRGANTPLGIQALTRQAYVAANITTVATGILPGIILRAIFPQLDDAVTLLDQPATRQLLLLRATNGTGNTSTNTFINDVYQPMVTFPASGPQPAYRFVTASLGSACGTWTLQPSQALVQVDAGVFLGIHSFLSAGVRTDISVNALPHYSSASPRLSKLRLYSELRLPFGIRFTSTMFSQSFNAPTNVPCWDGVPGGTRNKSVDVGTGARGFDWLLLGADRNIQLTERFCFVPTVSALDIADINANTLAGRYVNGIPSASFSRAAAFQAAARGYEPYSNSNLPSSTIANFLHPFFRGRQAHWLFDELQRPYNGNSNAASCDPNVECNAAPPVAISGPTSACGAVTYTVTAPLAGATYQWTTSPAGAFSPASYTGPSFSTTAGGPNDGQVTVTLVSACPSAGLTASVPVIICKPLTVAITNLSYLDNNCRSAHNNPNFAQWTAQATGGNGPYTFRWYFDATGSGNNYQLQSTPILTQGAVTTFGTCMNQYTYYVRAKVEVTDGTTTVWADYYAQPIYRQALYPNPANGYVDVAAIAAPAPTTGSTNTQARSTTANYSAERTPTARITVYNGQGKVVYDKASSATADTRLDTQAWPTGLYQVVMQSGSTRTRTQLSVEH
jgi:hypothetical protein